jgi:hypothetical protein
VPPVRFSGRRPEIWIRQPRPRAQRNKKCGVVTRQADVEKDRGYGGSLLRCWRGGGLNSSPYVKKCSVGLPQPIRPQGDSPPDQQPQPEREQQNPDRRPRGSGLGSGPGGVRSAMPLPPTPPQCERAVPRQRGLSAHQVLPTNGETAFLPRPPNFPGRDYRYLAPAGFRFRASGGRTRPP